MKPHFSPNTATPMMPEGALFNFDESGPNLHLVLDSPSQAEIAAIRRGETRFALVPMGPALFLLTKFGDFDWLDAPYSIRMLPAKSRRLSADFRPGMRYVLTVTIVDRSFRCQYGSRLVTFSPHFSSVLHNLAERQLGQPYSQQEYDAAIERAYAKYPTARHMLRDAIATCKGGEESKAGQAGRCTESHPHDPQAAMSHGAAAAADTAADPGTLAQRVTASGIEHVTLTTGHRRISSSDEVGANVVQELLPVFPPDGTNRVMPMPGFSDTHILDITTSGSSLLATIYQRVGNSPAPVLTLGVGLNPEVDGTCWQLLHVGSPLPCATRGPDAPSRPWVAARLEIGTIFSSLEFIMAAGDFERCLAWAFVEHLSRKGNTSASK